jgi:hypothetical protein
VQFNDVPVGRWCKERVGASDDEKKFLMGIVTVDRNKPVTESHGCNIRCHLLGSWGVGSLFVIVSHFVDF